MESAVSPDGRAKFSRRLTPDLLVESRLVIFVQAGSHGHALVGHSDLLAQVLVHQVLNEVAANEAASSQDEDAWFIFRHNGDKGSPK